MRGAQVCTGPKTVRPFLIAAGLLSLLLASGWSAGAEQAPQTMAGHGSQQALQERIESLTPDIARAAELVPDELRLLGCDGPRSTDSGLQQASRFTVAVYFECLPGVPSEFRRDLIANLAGIDIARMAMHAGNLQPGEVFKRDLQLYVPRNAPVGLQTLAVGFASDRAPGEAQTTYLTPSMARLLNVDILRAAVPAGLSAEEKSPLWNEVAMAERRNLLVNGSFERGTRGWQAPGDVWRGKGGWLRTLSVSTDSETSLEGKRSLRIDFGGGQDPNFYSVKQFVEVKPNTEYTVSYFIMTQDITSHSGPCMSVYDPAKDLSEFYVSAPENTRFTGTHEWTRVEFSFTTPVDTRQVGLQFRRYGSGPQRYVPDRYGPIGGSAWYDGVQLVEGP